MVQQVRQRHAEAEDAVPVAARPGVCSKRARRHAGQRPRKLRLSHRQAGVRHHGFGVGGVERGRVARGHAHAKVRVRQKLPGEAPDGHQPHGPQQPGGQARGSRLLAVRQVVLQRAGHAPPAGRAARLGWHRRARRLEQLLHRLAAAGGGDAQHVRQRHPQQHVALLGGRRQKHAAAARPVAHNQRRLRPRGGQQTRQERRVGVRRCAGGGGGAAGQRAAADGAAAARAKRAGRGGAGRGGDAQRGHGDRARSAAAAEQAEQHANNHKRKTDSGARIDCPADTAKTPAVCVCVYFTCPSAPWRAGSCAGGACAARRARA